MSDFDNVTTWVFDGVAVLTDANTGYSSWYDCRALQGCQFFSQATSTGAATLTIVAQLSPVEYDTIPTASKSKNPASYYEEVTIATTCAKTGMFHEPPDGTNSYSVFDRPFGQVRFKVTVGTADATAVYLAFCRNGLNG